MYSREKRMKAIELYIKYDKSAPDVVRKLGYPSRPLLSKWYKAYLKEQETGVLWERYLQSEKCSIYSLEQKKAAVEYFLEHGQNKSLTVRVLGYPTRETLGFWCNELAPWTRKKRVGGVQYTKEQKKDTIITPCTRADGAVREYDIILTAFYEKNNLLGKEDSVTLKSSKDKPLPDDKDALLSEIESLKKQIRKLKLEKDILEGTAEIIKKDPGVDPKNLTNKEKASLIDALRNEYPLKELLNCLKMARSSYFYHHNIELMPDKYVELRSSVIKLFEENNRRYGYRRIHALLVREGTRISEKVVRRLMSESNLVVIGKKKRKYSSYQGEDHPSAANLIERDFRAEAPNVKWLTDITEFKIPAGKVYLSPVVDCFDGLLPSWTIGTRPDADLVNSMLDCAMETLKPDEYPIVHSDRGCHYRWPGWITRMEEAGLTRSMSRKGYSPDNAACEGVFGRIKNEMFYNRSWVGVGIDEFMNILDDYLRWYNEKRIKMSLGAKSPLEYRNSLGLAV